MIFTMKRIALLALISSLLFSIFSCSQKKESESIGEIKTAPYFILSDLNGKMVSIKDFNGKVLILNFWATWCFPCREEIPNFQDLYAQYKSKGLEIIGISLDEGGSDVLKTFVKDYRISYPILIGNEEVTNVYGGIRGIPTTFVINRKGDIIKKYIGYTDKETFEQDVKPLL